MAPLDTAARTAQVMFVVAPGGSGKTTLLADWARQAPVPVAWYAVDVADRDTRRLAAGLCAAVERVAPGAAAMALTVLETGGHEVAAIGLLLDALDGCPLALVLDDFHHLDGLPAAMALLDHVLRLRPPSLALVILSRSVPLFGFAALAAFDNVAGIGHEDLRFDADEAVVLLRVHGLEGETAAALVQRSGGWAAGLLLLARTAPTGLRMLRARADALMEHLGDEIVSALPDDVRAFLLHSAALGQASAEQTDAILGRDNSADVYADIAARGLFLDKTGDTYRYHDLFAEYLIGVLRATQPALLQRIRRAAATWWATHGDVARGLGLLAQIEDWEGLATMLERERTALWERGLGGTILAHVEALPPAYHTPGLLVLSGYARIRRAEYVEALELADRGMAAADDDDAWLSAAVLRVQALIYVARDDEAIRSADAALAVAQRIGHQKAVHYLREMRGTAHLRRGHWSDGRTDLAAVLAVHEQLGHEAAQARVLFNWATQLIAVGQTRDAADLLERARALQPSISENMAMISNIHNSRALLGLLTGELATARGEAERARDLARGQYPHLECWTTSTLALVCLDSGDIAAADRFATEARAMAERLDSDTLNEALRTHIAIALWRRDRAGARRLLDEAEPLAVAAIDKALLLLLDGMLALRSSAYHRAARALEQAYTALSDLNYPHHAARACFLRAEALVAIGRVRDVEETLNRLAELVLPPGVEGYLRPMARFARRVLAQHRALRRLRRDTRDLLERLHGGLKAKPALRLLSPSRPGVAAPATPTLSLSPFGQGRVRLNDNDIDPGILPPKARELLFWVAHVGNPVSRSEIFAALWDGDASPSSFWDAGRHLRRVFGVEAWGPNGKEYALRCTIDDAGQQFDRASATALSTAAEPPCVAAAEQALALYGDGGYLEWCDSLWCVIERERVARQALRVVFALAELYRASGRAEDALAVVRAALVRNPTEDSLCATLMRYLIDMGKGEDAVDEYQRYRSRLFADYAVKPADDVLRLVEVAAASVSRDRANLGRPRRRLDDGHG